MLARTKIIFFLIALTLVGCKGNLSFSDGTDSGDLSLTSNKGKPIGTGGTAGDADLERSQAYAVMEQYCFSCHGSQGYRGESWDLYSNAQWVDHGLIRVEGDYLSSQILQRLKHGSGAGDMPYTVGSRLWQSFSQSDYEKMRAWVESVAIRARSGGNPDVISSPVPEVTPRPELALIEMDLRLMDRLGVKAVLDDVFGPAAANVATNAVIYNSLSQFGGPCDPKAQVNLGCDNVDAFDTGAPLVNFSSTPREGLRMKACNLLVFNDTTLRAAITSVRGAAYVSSIASNPRPTASDVQGVYQLFNPGRAELPSSVVSSFLQVSQSIAVGPGSMDPWRALILTLCYSPDWQVP